MKRLRKTDKLVELNADGWLEILEAIARIRRRCELWAVVDELIRKVFPFEECRLCYKTDENGIPTAEGDYYINIIEDLFAPVNDLSLEIIQGKPSKISETLVKRIHISPMPIIGETSPIDDLHSTQENKGDQQARPREFIGVRVKNRDAIFGHIIFITKNKGFYTEKDFPRFQIIANQLGIAMANILAYEEIQAREQEKGVRLEIINALTAQQSGEELITQIAAAMNKIVPLDAFALHLQRDGEFLDFEFNDLRAVKKGGSFVPLRRYAFWRDVGISSEKVREMIRKSAPLLTKKASYVGADYQKIAGENELIRLITEHFNFRSIMYAPVRLQNGALMTLAASSRKDYAYSEAILDKFCETGAQIALAVESKLALVEISELKKRLEDENDYLAEEVKTAYDFGEIVGTAPALVELFSRLEIVAPTDTTVLLEGETGTGKELFARAIHDLSPRKTRPLIKINCAALPTNLIESELFGHERGAFTGASERRIGKFELAHQGTIFLDEIGELTPDLQAKLLRVLQEREVERIGGKMPLKIDIRIVAATNRNLYAEVLAKRFREDLFYRLNTVTLTLPPLRTRREDIPALALHFAAKYAARIGRQLSGISNQMLTELLNYDFPGNIRELEHIIEEAVIFSKSGLLQLHRPLSFEIAAANSAETPLGRAKTIAEIEREYILEILDRTSGRIRGEEGAAKILDLKPTTLEARMKKLGIRKKHL